MTQIQHVWQIMKLFVQRDMIKRNHLLWVETEIVITVKWISSIWDLINHAYHYSFDTHWYMGQNKYKNK